MTQHEDAPDGAENAPPSPQGEAAADGLAVAGVAEAAPAEPEGGKEAKESAAKRLGKTIAPGAGVAVLVIAGLAASIYTARKLESPQVSLNREIDELVEQAQRMLDAYEPAGERLLASMAVATQPVEPLPEDQWHKHLDYEAFKSRMQSQDQRLRTQMREFVRLAGEPRPPGGTDILAFPQLKHDLEANQALIDDALATVQKAVAMKREGGGTTVKGTSHPAATQLEAILFYHKADILRRRAALHRATADATRARVRRIRNSWRELGVSLRALERDRPAGLPAEENALEPAAASPAAGGQAQPQGVLGHLARLLFGRKKAGALGAPDETPAIIEPAAPEEPPPPEVVEIPDPWWLIEPGADQPSTLKGRLTALELKREKVESQIEQARADVATWTTKRSKLEQKHAAAWAAAREADRKMAALKESELDSTDPGALDRFTAEYQAASKAYREAWREASALADGPARHDGVDAGDADRGEGPLMTPQEKGPRRGLIAAARGELRIAKARLRTLQGVLSTIDAQIKGVRKRQQDVAKQYQSLQAARKALQDDTIQTARAAMAAVLEADRREIEAIGLLAGQGPAKQAAENAVSAAGKRRRAGDFVKGHAQTINADLTYLHAQVLAQRADNLARHHGMLGELAEMGIPGAACLPEGASTKTVPAYLFDYRRAGNEARGARDHAIKEAEAALTLYEQAEGDLNRLWVVRANQAAVEYLLANLNSGPQADEHRTEAIKKYRESIQDRPDLPEAELYKTVIRGLTDTSP